MSQSPVVGNYVQVYHLLDEALLLQLKVVPFVYVVHRVISGLQLIELNSPPLILGATQIVESLFCILRVSIDIWMYFIPLYPYPFASFNALDGIDIPSFSLFAKGCGSQRQ
jgi:hypothetical protein